MTALGVPAPFPGRAGRNLAAALCALLSAALVFAGGRAFWRFETAADFRAGESEGVSIGPEGQVRLAPVLRTLSESEQPFVWAVAGDGEGGALAGVGGQLLRVGGGDAAEVLADTGEVGVHAVARGADGSIFFATSPNGSVQRLQPDGERTIHFDPEARYIWALAAEPGGSLLVATGMPAALFRVQPSGNAEEIFTTREENITALHRAADGAIHLGTEPSGIVFRIAPESGAMALYDTPQTEIRSLAVNAAGEVFAAAVAESPDAGAAEPAGAPSLPEPPATIASVSAATSFRVLAQSMTARGQGAASSANGASGPENALYRIAPSGAAETIWESAADRPLSLALLRDERLLLGTGDRGRVYRITRDGEATLLLRAESEQITAAATEGGRTLLGASNPGRVLEIAAGPRTEGRYRSRALDAGGAARFGRISWEARTPPGSALLVETRSGNSEEPDDTWSGWLAARTGESSPSPAARFLQWRAILRSDGSTSPELVSLEAAYLPANLAPRVTGITLHPPGRAFEQMLNPASPRLQGMDHLPETTEAARAGQPGGGLPSGSGRQLYRHGVRTATFEASDPNGDRLRYRVSYRRAGEVAWRPLRDGLRDAIVAWDTSQMPDGRYQLRVEVEDTPDNPPGEALRGSRVSRPFTIDNTPPVISDLAADADGTIRFRASDAGSPIRRAAVSLDGGPARVIRPMDGVADSPSEDYAARLPDLPPGAASVVVQVEDDLGNWSTAEARLGG